MDTEKSLVKASETRLPKFVEAAYDSIDQMNKFADTLLQSKLIPFHFYEKGPDNKPDFNKGKTPAVVAVLIQGYQLQLPPLTALQHIVPVNGLLSIKGDMAKSLIFSSGKLQQGSWKEEEIGSLEEGNYCVKITAARSDNGMQLTRSFSIEQAKRAGLWITEQQMNGQDGWKYKSSAWWKYPTRMIGYRALGFISRDLFSDVLNGVYTTEEALDLPKETTEYIETPDGAKITIPDKEHAQKRSGKMTERVSEKIHDNKFGAVKDNIQDATIVPETKEEPARESSQATRGTFGMMNGEVVVNRDNASEQGNAAPEQQTDKHTGRYSLKDLEAMDTKVLLEMVNADMDMMEACEMIGGKNTNKKLRGIVYAYQEGNLKVYVADNLPKEQSGVAPGSTDQQGDVFTAPEQREEIQQGGMPVNRAFDQSGPQKQSTTDFLTGEKKEVTSGNKYNLNIPAFDKGNQRDFASMKTLFNLMAGLNPSLNNPRYLELAAKAGIIGTYPDRETFCKLASVEEVNKLLNIN